MRSEYAWLNGGKAGSMHLETTTTGSIVFEGVIAAATMDLVGGDVRQGSRSSIITDVLSGSLAHTVKLTGDNRIARLDGFSAGSLELTDQASKLEITGTNTVMGPVLLNTSGDLQFSSGASLNADKVSITAGGLFTNLAGPGAIGASTQWAIYLDAPEGHSFGGLDSTNRAVWGSDAASRPLDSLTGNRYVFHYAPTLTLSSVDLTKDYGTDASAQLANAYTVAGLSSGVTNAFFGDTLAEVITGTPILTSSGVAANASVAGGPYVVEIAAGSTSSTAGYVLAFANHGRVRVTPKHVSGGVTVQDKIYDGGLGATGNIVLTGILFDDKISAAGTFRFLDKNAGTGKTVVLSDLQVSGADSANYQVTLPTSLVADILRKEVVVSVAADSKTYDQTRTATGRIDGIDGLVAGDVVTAGGGAFQFSDKNAGMGKTVAVSDVNLGGADAGNYDFVVPATTTANIYRRAVDVSVAVDSKIYDGTITVAGRVNGTTGILDGDRVLVSGGTYSFADKNVGTAKQVRVSGLGLSGDDAANYALGAPNSASASITRKAVSVAFAVDSKTYDGTITGVGRVTGVSGVIAGDDLSLGGGSYAFADKNAGAAKQVSLSGVTAHGADAGNYELVAAVGITADIFRKAISAKVMADNKTYDGITAATGRVTTLDGLIAGDQVTIDGATYAFADKDAGSGKQVLVSGLSMGGADARNYMLAASASVTADILRRSVQVGIVAEDRVYDGTTAASGRVTSITGLIRGDSLTVSGGRFAFADADAGSNKSVTVAGLTLGGADSGNYVIAGTSAATASILKRSLTVRANDTQVSWFGAAAPLSYTIVSGSIAPGDRLTGSLTREAGEMPGTYRIERGTLAIGPNYDVRFVPGTYVIENRGAPRFLQPRNLYQELELGGRAELLTDEVLPIRWTGPLAACADDAPKCE